MDTNTDTNRRHTIRFLESKPENFTGHLVKTKCVYQDWDPTEKKSHMWEVFYFPVGTSEWSDIKLAMQIKVTFINMHFSILSNCLARATAV